MRVLRYLSTVCVFVGACLCLCVCVYVRVRFNRYAVYAVHGSLPCGPAKRPNLPRYDYCIKTPESISPAVDSFTRAPSQFVLRLVRAERVYTRAALDETARGDTFARLTVKWLNLSDIRVSRFSCVSCDVLERIFVCIYIIYNSFLDACTHYRTCVIIVPGKTSGSFEPFL